MPNRRQFVAASYYVIWTVLLAAFVSIGAREVWIGSRGAFIHDGPFSSTDAYLKALLEIPNGSEQCAGIMRQLSGSQAIYFCPRRDPKGHFVYGLLAYLSPPRQMRMVEIEGVELEQKIASVDRRSTSALIFFGLQPPSEFKGWRVGPNLFIVPLDGSQ